MCCMRVCLCWIVYDNNPSTLNKVDLKVTLCMYVRFSGSNTVQPGHQVPKSVHNPS